MTTYEEEYRYPEQETSDEEFNEIFLLFDKDSDGKILDSDIMDCLKTLGVFINKEKEMQIKKFREQYKGKISKEIFIQLYNHLISDKKSKKEQAQELEMALAAFNNGDTEYIDSNLFVNALSSFGNKINPEKIKDILAHVSWNEDNSKFNYLDLINYILEDQ